MVERIEDTCIRIRSEMNEWMDCIFIVSEEDAVRAEKGSRWLRRRSVPHQRYKNRKK